MYDVVAALADNAWKWLHWETGSISSQASVRKHAFDHISIRRVLSAFGMLWLITAWILRVCERPVLDRSWAGQLWLAGMTLLSCGVGDIVPHTLCGRTVLLLMLGVGMFLLVALIMVLSLSQRRWHSGTVLRVFPRPLVCVDPVVCLCPPPPPPPQSVTLTCWTCVRVFVSCTLALQQRVV
jgi:hypothetical protein